MLRRFGARLITINPKPQRNISFLNRITGQVPVQEENQCGCESHCKYERNRMLMQKSENLSLYTDIGIIASCLVCGFLLKSSLVLPLACGLIMVHRAGYALHLQEEFQRKLDKYSKLCKNKNTSHFC